MKNSETEGQKKRRGLRVYLPLAGVILVVAAAGFYWYREYSKYISTDDANIDADRVSVSSKILGRITNIYVDEGDTVRKGLLLAEIDSTDLVAQKNQALAMKNQAVSSQLQSEAKYIYDQESIKLLEINSDKAKDDFARAKDQYEGNVIPKEQYDHLKKAFESAQAQLEAAKTQLNVSKAQVSSAAAAVESADAQVGVTTTQLHNTRLYAPSDGIVARRWLLPGDMAQPGQAIYTIYSDQKLWVTIYLEETKLSGVRIDQPAKFTVDAVPHVTFYGKVIFIGSNTAAQFSLIPPNNASGNFTKVTQRVPLKLSIDSTNTGKNPETYHLIAGMSVVAKIIKD
jgi:membrane fusion protein (multidrug efflux system)